MIQSVIIRKEKIKIRTASEQYALQVRKQLTDSLQFDLMAMMENVFAQIESPGVYINIDKIKIDLGRITSKDLGQYFVKLVEEKLVNELQKHFPRNNEGFAARHKKNSPDFDDTYFEKDFSSQFSNAQQQNLNALLYFIENGMYPWWYKESIRQTPEQLLSSLTKDEIEALLLKIISLEKKRSVEELQTVIDRLFIHLPHPKNEALLYHLLALYNEPSLSHNVQQLVLNKKDLQQLYRVPEKDFYSRLFRFLLSENSEAGKDTIKNFIRQLEFHQKNDIEASSIEIEKEVVKRKPPRNPENEEGIYISNAGLILLHPFLQPFFAELGLLTDKNQFISIAAQHKATVLLYYLQTNNEDYKEWEMALNKIICGMRYDELIPDGIIITASEKEESRSLLQSVVSYWEALKGASIESMQNTFFMREGKIMWKDENWLIQIERTGFDILIEKLPWGITTIKLPWLQHIIFTEW